MENKKGIHEEANVELGGMGLYGTTTNAEIAGYKATGDIENAGHPERGFQQEQGHRGAAASRLDAEQRD